MNEGGTRMDNYGLEILKMITECEMMLNGLGDKKITVDGKEYVFITNSESETEKTYRKVADMLEMDIQITSATTAIGTPLENYIGLYVVTGTPMELFWSYVREFEVKKKGQAITTSKQFEKYHDKTYENLVAIIEEQKESIWEKDIEIQELKNRVDFLERHEGVE